ncbi:fatty acid-binding protein, adipocyte-like [Amphiura filiformis]|uniref:fatty acid-binding protein, adipocyte-like n=1 Tax=Amphiura filiformis TaxID=82378 RepID=UPI003B210BAF
MAENASPADFNGTWKLESTSPNFEELLAAMNVNFVVRKAAANVSPEITIKQDGDDFTIIMKVPLKTTEMKFKVGEEFKDKHPLKDEENQVLVTWDGNALVQKCVNNDKNPVLTRTIEDGKLVVKQKLGDIEAHRIFVKC